MIDVQRQKTIPQIEISVVQSLTESELSELCDATLDTINDLAGSFTMGSSRSQAPTKELMQSYWKGVFMVPERQLIIGKLDKVVASSIQLIRPLPSNQTSAFAVSIENHFVAPWARGYGLARELLFAAERKARQEGFQVLKLSTRAGAGLSISMRHRAISYGAPWKNMKGSTVKWLQDIFTTKIYKSLYNASAIIKI